MAKIYGTPLMMGGGGGANKDLPPLLDNFKAFKGGGTKLKDLPDGTKVKFGTYNGQPLVWKIIHDGETTKAIMSVDTSTHTTAIGSKAISPSGLTAAENWAITGWLNATEPANLWETSWATGGVNEDSPSESAPIPYASEAGFLNGWSADDLKLLQSYQFDYYGYGQEQAGVLYTYESRVAIASGEEMRLYSTQNSDRAYRAPSRAFNDGSAGFDGTNPAGSVVNGEFSVGNLKESHVVWPACAPNPEAVVSQEPDDDGCYTIDYDALYVTIQADKIAASRANELAGAVWVYGDHEPTSVNDGTKIELTKGEVVDPSGEDATVQKVVSWNNDSDFFARQFTYNSKKQYQTMLEGAIANINLTSQSIAELPSGSKVKLGTWNDTPLQWKVARDTSDQSLRLVLEPTSVTLLGTKQFDAPEPSNSDNSRRSDGNNRYIYSNIHQWLNATQAAGWYTAQHSADASPAYASSPGFLSGWSENHLNALDKLTWTVTRSSVDGGGTETFVSRIALMSTTELGLESGTGNGRLDIFNSDGDRATGSSYWTRTPSPSSSRSVRRVHSSGTLYNDYASGDYWLRPLCSPKSTTYVSLEPDGDGCYTITGVNE